MAARRPAPLFVDTAAFFADANQRSTEHDRARSVFSSVQSGDLPFDRLVTSRYVLSELATLLLRKASHRAAVSTLSSIREAPSITVCRLDEAQFDRACEQFGRYDDQQISFVDHASAVLADDFGVEHVFTFDRDDFRTLGFTVVPADIGDG